MAGVLLRRSPLLKFRRGSFFEQWRTGYIVLLPEVGHEVGDLNPLFKGGVPDIKNLTQETCSNTLGKYLLDFEHSVREIEADIIQRGLEAKKEGESDQEQNDNMVENGRGVLDRLEEGGWPLEVTWSLVKTLYLVDTRLIPPQLYLPLHDRARRARVTKYTSRYIYNALKEVDESKLSEEESRVVKKFLVEGKLNGLELEGDKKLLFQEISRSLAEEQNQFKGRMQMGLKQFSHSIMEESNLTRDLPPDLLQVMSKDGDGKGPWKVDLSTAVFDSFMAHCPDRLYRYNVWIASRQVASPQSDPQLNNSNAVQKIRSLRRDLADVLGYESFAHMSMETKIAGSLENVQNILDSFLEKARPAQEKELESLQEFAKERGFEGDLKLWDIPYWARKQKKTLYNWDESAQRCYFPLDKVWPTLLEICSEMFSVRFEVRPEVATWDPTVLFYYVYDAGSSKAPIAGFYYDPYHREGKLNIGRDERRGELIGLRPKCRVSGGAPPLATLVFNFHPPGPGAPSNLSFSALDTLVRKFGSCLQFLLSCVNYSEVSGSSNIEWDAVQTLPNIMSLLLYDKRIMERISSHEESGEPLPVTQLEDVRRHMAGFKLCHELYLASINIRLHLSKDYWGNLMREEWSRHMIPSLDKSDYHLCSQLPDPGYYSSIWSTMLAADALTSLQDVNSFGSRLRDTLLGFGGSCDPREVFRRFQGRDPTPEVFITTLGLDPSPINNNNNNQ